jgi:hypothetical protein
VEAQAHDPRTRPQPKLSALPINAAPPPPCHAAPSGLAADAGPTGWLAMLGVPLMAVSPQAMTD